jgi:pimeloyl-ACP methyl ester carboxylesterase
MPTASANGIQIYYELHGPGSGVPLVLTHGFAGPFEQWKPEVLPFAETRPLLLYDVRGHHRTTVRPDPADYSMPVFAADLAGLLDALGIERAHIGGVSMGGMVTAQFAVDYPQRCASVIVCDSTCGNTDTDDAAGGWERRLREGISTLRHMVQTYGLEETVRREQAWKTANDPHLSVSPYTFDEDFTRIAMMTVEGYVGAATAILERPDLAGCIGGITPPTLIMIGEWDDFYPCALRDHALIAGSRLVTRRRCGHGSRWRVETFRSEIESFLADVEAGRDVAGEWEV